ncbi:MliC family protein [Sandaracinobacter sp. RS1-74]|uniref:MliC family protein n=1 Tax=Sandaracinobacteroides sayramensis TaxID=2913411 RepID=UPI001EDBA86F|nr:MliC family protein [Sandaracinobacteroides sayramensis]MCG2842842.1 MliC family protein [Sandaracinobacteroides sayramensis]
MARAILLASGLMALTACSTSQTPGSGNTLDARMMGEFNYVCAAGVPATVVFSGTGPTAELRFKGEVRVLERQPTRSGWVYSDGSTQIMGNGDQLQIATPDVGILNCRKA